MLCHACLQGEALPGTVVAILPGLTYTRTQYSRMPNFPRIDTANPYLSRTYVMVGVMLMMDFTVVCDARTGSVFDLARRITPERYIRVAGIRVATGGGGIPP
jgi:hypothetical protein